MARFNVAAGLEAKVAQMIAPAITRITRVVADEAKSAAPDDKLWITEEDEFVRPEHEKAHGQRRPVNLRFILDSPDYDKRHGWPDTQMCREPRDEILSDGLLCNCRCNAFPAESSLAAAIEAHPAKTVGTRVTGEVTCVHDFAVNAEFGNALDSGARFLGTGLRSARRKLR